MVGNNPAGVIWQLSRSNTFNVEQPNALRDLSVIFVELNPSCSSRVHALANYKKNGKEGG